MHRMLRCLISIVSVGTAMSCAAADAQGFPARPMRIVTSSVGGVADLVARLIAQGLTSSLGQQVIVDNRPPGIVPGEIVVKAAPDGYTLLFHGSSLWAAGICCVDQGRDGEPGQGDQGRGHTN